MWTLMRQDVNAQRFQKDLQKLRIIMFWNEFSSYYSIQVVTNQYGFLRLILSLYKSTFYNCNNKLLKNINCMTCYQNWLNLNYLYIVQNNKKC